MSSFLDNRVFSDSQTIIDPNVVWSDVPNTGNYPISAIEFSRIAERQALNDRKVVQNNNNEEMGDQSDEEFQGTDCRDEDNQG